MAIRRFLIVRGGKEVPPSPPVFSDVYQMKGFAGLCMHMYVILKGVEMQFLRKLCECSEEWQGKKLAVCS